MLYLILFLGLCLLVDTLYRKLPAYALKRIDISRRMVPERIVAGEEAVLETTVRNLKWLPLPWIRFRTIVPWQFDFKHAKTVQLRKDESCMHTVTSSLLFYERLLRKDPFRVQKRGFYKLEGMDFETGDVFGWIETEMPVSCPVRLWVHPRVKALASLVQDTRSLYGEISVRRWIVPDPMFTVGARDYTDRDPLSAIDWKATARVNRLQVKKFDHTADRSVQVFLDTQSAPTFWRHLRHEVVEYAIDIAASAIQESLDAKIPVGLVVNNLALDGRRIMNVPQGLGVNHRTYLMDTLAMTTAFRTESMHTVMQQVCRNLAEHTLVVVITAYLSEELAHTLNILAARGFAIKLMDLTGSNAAPNPLPLHRSIARLVPAVALDETITELPGGDAHARN